MGRALISAAGATRSLADQQGPPGRLRVSLPAALVVGWWPEAATRSSRNGRAIPEQPGYRLSHFVPIEYSLSTLVKRAEECE